MSTLQGFAAFAPLLALLCWAAVVDLRERRIPNWLNLLLILSGVAQSLIPGHWLTPAQSLLGLFAAALVPFLLFALGAMGAGDVKLMAGIGAWLGPGPGIAVLIVEKVIGLTIVLLQAASERRMGVLLRNSAVVVVNLLHVKEVGLEHATQTGRACRSVARPLPFAVPVLMAVVLVLWRLGGRR
jgi:prepilin peptidase CpaA